MKQILIIVNQNIEFNNEEKQIEFNDYDGDNESETKSNEFKQDQQQNHEITTCFGLKDQEATQRLVSDAAKADSPTCLSCGNLMQRNGSCYVCTACGATSGCSQFPSGNGADCREIDL